MAQKPKEHERSMAEFLYCEKGVSLTEISERINIPIKTLSAWKKGRKGESAWDDRKRINIASPLNIKEFILLNMEKIARGEKVDIDSDQLVKLSVTLDRIEKKINPQIIVSVIMMLETFTAKESPEEAVRSLATHKKFILHILKNG